MFSFWQWYNKNLQSIFEPMNGKQTGPTFSCVVHHLYSIFEGEKVYQLFINIESWCGRSCWLHPSEVFSGTKDYFPFCMGASKKSHLQTLRQSYIVRPHLNKSIFRKSGLRSVYENCDLLNTCSLALLCPHLKLQGGSKKCPIRIFCLNLF